LDLHFLSDPGGGQVYVYNKKPSAFKPRERKKENPGIRGGLFFRVRKNAFLIC
jgi:hypothetical protein